MISWEEYVKTAISKFRQLYTLLSNEGKKEIRLGISLNSPTQVIVIDFEDTHLKFVIVLHSKKRLDKEIVVFDNVKYEDFPKITKDPEFRELVNSKTTKYLSDEWESILSSGRTPEWTLRRIPLEGGWLAIFGYDPRGEELPVTQYLGAINIDFFFKQYERKKQRKEIEETVTNIKQDAEAILETDVRKKILVTTGRLERQIEQLDKRIDDEISSIRQRALAYTTLHISI